MSFDISSAVETWKADILTLVCWSGASSINHRVYKSTIVFLLIAWNFPPFTHTKDSTYPRIFVTPDLKFNCSSKKSSDKGCDTLSLELSMMTMLYRLKYHRPTRCYFFIDSIRLLNLSICCKQQYIKAHTWHQPTLWADIKIMLKFFIYSVVL